MTSYTRERKDWYTIDYAIRHPDGTVEHRNHANDNGLQMLACSVSEAIRRAEAYLSDKYAKLGGEYAIYDVGISPAEAFIREGGDTSEEPPF